MSAMQSLLPVIDDDARWRAMSSNDGASDGMFVCAVRTTRIYCRPTCTARLPKRENVRFYENATAAEAAGYRACKRCQPQAASPDAERRALVARVCRRLEAEDDVLSLDQLGAEFGLSPFHLQRVFKRIAGVTPRQYAAAHRIARLKGALRTEPGGVAGAIYGAGYGSSSRAYESAPMALGMTPAAYGKRGAGMRIAYSISDCVLGRLLVAATDRGIASVCVSDHDAILESTLRHEYSAANIRYDDEAIAGWRDAVVRAITDGRSDSALPTDVQATAFQARVWQALREIPPGETRSYREIACTIGRPNAQRAVANACAANPTAIIVPCHRVVRTDGSAGGYRWGVNRKRKLLEAELARAQERMRAPGGGQ